jgi:hypothetical protein
MATRDLDAQGSIQLTVGKQLDPLYSYESVYNAEKVVQVTV